MQFCESGNVAGNVASAFPHLHKTIIHNRQLDKRDTMFSPADVAAAACPHWCSTHKEKWEKKCGWNTKHCSGCSQCGPSGQKGEKGMFGNFGIKGEKGSPRPPSPPSPHPAPPTPPHTKTCPGCKGGDCECSWAKPSSCHGTRDGSCCFQCCCNKV